eukprot:9113121-Ditylum_brightwellii.AAC.1
MEDRQLWDSAKCPRNCGEEMETPEHVVQCCKANNLWTKAKSILIEWGQKNKAAPGLMATFLTGIDKWRNHEDDYDQQNVNTILADAVNRQSKIGWDAALKGILTQKWAEIQHDYFVSLGL